MRQRLRAAAAAVCAALLAFPGIGWGAPVAIGGNDFVARLDNARRLAEAGAAQPAPSKMQSVRAALGLPLDVQLPDGTVHVPADGLLDGLRGTTAEDFRSAGDHLAAMEDAAKAAVAAKAPDPAVRASALKEALRGIRTEPTLFERIRHDIWVLAVSLWQRITGAVNRIPLPHGLLAILAAGILGLVAVILVRRLGYLVPEHQGATAASSRPKKTDWERLAREAIARGDLVEAVRARYGALLAALAGRGIVPETPSLTAGECRRAVAGGLPGAYPAVAKATTVFESVLYGRAEATTGSVDSLAAAERSVRAA